MMPVRLSVHLSVTEVHWRIIANFGFKFRSHFTAHWPSCCCGRHAAGGHRAACGRRAACAGESFRAMLASARSLVLLLCENTYLLVLATDYQDHYGGKVFTAASLV